jgi:hypothetical protein
MTALFNIGRALPELNVQTPEGSATTVQAHLGPQKPSSFPLARRSARRVMPRLSAA